MIEQVRELTADIVRDWVNDTDGWFSSRDMDVDLCVNHAKNKAHRRVIMHRLLAEGVIKQHISKSHTYRRVQREARDIDWPNADPENYLHLKWPFYLEYLVKIYPRNVVVVAGEPNCGKTSFCIDFVARNQMPLQDKEIYYFTSEMDAEEFQVVLSKFDDVAGWSFHAKDRSHNFADVIVPDAINIIDFLEVTDEFYKVGGEMSEIRDALGKGIAIIALQKNPGAEAGVGGTRGLEKPRLYLTLDQKREKKQGYDFRTRVQGLYEMKILKAKFPMDNTIRPNGMSWEYKFAEGGSLFDITKYPSYLPPNYPVVAGGYEVIK